MQVSKTTYQATSAVFTPVAVGFIQESITIMIPWLMVMIAIVITDLIAGVRKSLKLGIHVSISTAIRETMGKLVVYFAFVTMVAMIDVATDRGMNIATWACLLVCFIESISIFGNILKPYGYDLNLKNILKVGMEKKFDLDDEQAGSIISDGKHKEIKEREEAKWNRRVK